jgi:predicted ATPase
VFVDERLSEDFTSWQPLEGLEEGISAYSQLHSQSSRYGGSTAKSVLEDLKNWVAYHFNDTSATARLKATSSLHDNARLRHDASNLAAILYLFQEKYPDNYQAIVQTIRLAAPFFQDFSLRPDPLSPQAIRLEWRQIGWDAYLNASTLSDGTLRFMCLTTLLMQPTLPSTILIDEPELGLHPYALTLLAAMLQSAATKTQVIVSTQSAPLVSQFAPEDIIVVEQQEGQSVFRRLDTKSIEAWLEDYSLGEIWEKNIFGGRP